MISHCLKAGAPFPEVVVSSLNGETMNLGKPKENFDWKMLIVYRGKHCPICTNYLKTLNMMVDDFNEIGVDIAIVSADPLDKVEDQMNDVDPKFDVGYGLTVEQMKLLGLYISNPRSDQETDRPFAEPGLFVINSDGLIQVLDVSNAPFARPELSSLLRGLTFIRNPENNYPIRGTFQ